MKTFSHSLPAAHETRSGFLQQVMQWLAAAAERRRARRRTREIAELLAQMDSHLLDDIGMSVPKDTSAIKGLAEMHPAYLAATAFSRPRKERR